MNAWQPVCQGCGRPIQGDAVQALGANWHPEHFLCAGCGRPIQSGNSRFMLHDGAPFHSECYSQRFASRCAYCGKLLLGRYLVDQWGTKFCQEHQGQFPLCAFCGRLVPPGQGRQTPGGLSCAICSAQAVETIEDARPLYEQVKRWVSKEGLVYHGLPLSLELCDRARLDALAGGSGPAHSLGTTASMTYTQNGRVVRTEVSGVAVLQALPAILFQGVTAHELGHVWLVVHSVRNLPSWAEEGFCELLSYRYYQDVQTAEGQYHAEGIERNPDPIYGDGFRHVKALVDRYSFPRFLEILQTTKRLPA